MTLQKLLRKPSFRKLSLMLSLISLVWAVLGTGNAYGQTEEQRQKGFRERKAQERAADIEREQGLREFLREQAAWEEKRQQDAKADHRRKKEQTPGEDSPEYKAHLKARLAEYEEYEQLRQEFVRQKKSHDAKNDTELAKRNAWAMEELGLDQKRPRFDIAKRSLYGKPSTGSSSASGGATFGGNGNFGGSTQSFPDPVYNNEFDGYVPPPPFPDQNGGYFPPADGGFVPPPSYPGSDDYYPPPPPIPQGFDNGGY